MFNTSQEQYLACKQCDTLVTKPILQEGEQAHCNRCGEIFIDKKINSINRTLAIALAGLIILFPAILLPLMGVGAAGIYNEASLLDCITLMIDSQFYIIAFCVFLFTVAVPVVRLIAAIYICYHVKFNKIKPSLIHFFRSYHYLDSWAMLHVFLLGIVVSMYKLLQLADLSVGIGLAAFAFLLACSTLISVTLDQHLIWELLEEEHVDNHS
jgi:paraquat-inducible protein A